MTTGYGITGLGYSPLGNVGLGATGTFGSYDYCMPSTMGMTGMVPGAMGAMGMAPGVAGMYGYWTPEGAASMQQRIESSQITHAADMHTRLVDMEVANQRRSDNALIEKLLTNGELHLTAQNIKVKIKEGDRERIQIFEGLVIGRHGGGVSETYTVRKISSGVGVERIFPLHSPMVAKIEVVRLGKVRRAKLNYIRGLSAKSARIKERRN